MGKSAIWGAEGKMEKCLIFFRFPILLPTPSWPGNQKKEIRDNPKEKQSEKEDGEVQADQNEIPVEEGW